MSIISRVNSVTAWPSLETSAGIFEACSYERDDGFRSLCFTAPGTKLTPQRAFGGATRVAYRIAEERGVLLGIYVAKDLKRSGLATDLTRYFIDTIQPVEGVPFVGTGKIHKPLVALTFAAAGLEPVSKDYLVEILPQAASDTSAVPKVAIVHDNIPAEEIVMGSHDNRFYDVVNRDEVKLRYPAGSPEKIVALHTCYVPGELQA